MTRAPSDVRALKGCWLESRPARGYIRVAKGNNALHLEEQCAWAVPHTFTETNYPCSEDGSNVSRSHHRPLEPALQLCLDTL